jgi:hypothetical protein
MIVTRSMMAYAKMASRWSHRTDPIVASAPRKMDADSGDMRGAGWSNGSSLGFNGNARILVRWEFYPKNFLGFVQLACLVVLYRFLSQPCAKLLVDWYKLRCIGWRRAKRRRQGQRGKIVKMLGKIVVPTAL